MGACVSDKPRIAYPPVLFECPDKPNPDNIKTDNDLGAFIVSQDAVIDICKLKLKTLQDLLK